MCAAHASSSPPPTTAPWRTAITGAAPNCRSSKARCHIRECSTPSAAECDASEERSSPAQKCSPAPHSTTARTPSGGRAKNVPSPCTVASSSALRFSARFRRTMAMSPWRSIASEPDKIARSPGFVADMAGVSAMATGSLSSNPLERRLPAGGELTRGLSGPSRPRNGSPAHEALGALRVAAVIFRDARIGAQWPGPIGRPAGRDLRVDAAGIAGPAGTRDHTLGRAPVLDPFDELGEQVVLVGRRPAAAVSHPGHAKEPHDIARTAIVVVVPAMVLAGMLQAPVPGGGVIDREDRVADAVRHEHPGAVAAQVVVDPFRVRRVM